jgi:ATP-dependent RNA helicase DeaD
MSTTPAIAPLVDHFDQLPLHPALLTALERAGYDEPSPIQSAFIPQALVGHDVVGKAQTGTGKTAAFLLPILNKIDLHGPGPQAIILSPTRELSAQIAEHAEMLRGALPVRIVTILGGERYHAQFEGLKTGAHIVIGTPGRVIDHLQRGTLRLATLRFVVLDEADRMLDIGFRPDIEKILRKCPVERQTFLLSATLPPQVLKLAGRYMRRPLSVDVAPARTAVDTIRQTYISVASERKYALLLKVIEREQPRQCIIFTRTKRGADTIHEKLSRVNQETGVLHGDLPQVKRNRIMEAFRQGKLRFLVATDVVSRGIDVTGISHIVNYDLPDDPENYVHRIGRTGRMGRDGIAIAFATPDEGDKLTAIESLMNQLISEEHIEGFEAFPPKSAPVTETATKPALPAFGSRRGRKYSRRV